MLHAGLRLAGRWGSRADAVGMEAHGSDNRPRPIIIRGRFIDGRGARMRP